MIRVKLNEKARTELFKKLRLTGKGQDEIAKSLDISSRTLRGWRQGEHTLPKESLDFLLALTDFSLEQDDFELISQREQKSKAGKAGAKAQWRKYGPLGTDESRRTGGNRSYQLRKAQPGSIYSRKSIQLPERSPQLAEFIGIMIGDGGLTKYQARVTLNTKDDREFSAYVTSLIKELFDYQPQIYQRPKLNCTVINVSSVNFVDYLHQLGLPIGNKCEQRITIPEWILRDEQLVKACIRGLFDTDGSIYLERHRRATKIYSYPRLALASASDRLLDEVCKQLNSLDINAKVKNNQRLNIEAFIDIKKYFKLIGTSNPKHLRRWRSFTEESYSGLVHQS